LAFQRFLQGWGKVGFINPYGPLWGAESFFWTIGELTNGIEQWYDKNVTGLEPSTLKSKYHAIE
jgi:hypothetical protein